MWAKINKNESKLFRAAQVFFSTFKNEKLLFLSLVTKIKRSKNSMQKVKRKSHLNPLLEIPANKAVGYISSQVFSPRVDTYA